MTDLAAAGTVTEDSLEPYRREMTAYSYRMLGSAFEAEDAVQETMVRAWKGLDRFEGRAALRSWLYRIATNVCLDMLKSRERRARPMDVAPLGSADVVLGEPLAEATWIQPIPDGRVMGADSDPAEVAVLRETINLAFMAVLQHLPPRQRAVLILREVLQWRATEVAELLDTTVASVNSALQRARATLAETTQLESRTAGPDSPAGEAEPAHPAPQPPAEQERELLARYVDAFERYDMEALVAVLHDDATLSMPPYDLWMRGPDQIVAWMIGTGHGCQGSRLIATAANGSPAYGQYRPGGPNGSLEPWALQVIEVADGRVVGLNSFLDTDTLFPLFGLPTSLAD
jgi:RNA polymerase sigma-70 factor, ECF subfamily